MAGSNGSNGNNGSNGSDGTDLERTIDISFRTDPLSSVAGSSPAGSGEGIGGDGTRMAAPVAEGFHVGVSPPNIGELRTRKKQIEEILNMNDGLSSDLLDLRIPELESVERDMRRIGLDQYSEFWRPIMEFLDRIGLYTHENRIRAAYRRMESVAKGLERTIGKVDRKGGELFKAKQDNEQRLTLAGYLKRIYDCELGEMQAKEAELQGRKRELGAKRMGKPEALTKEATPLIEQILAIQTDIQRMRRKYAEVEDQIIMYDQRGRAFMRISERVEANRLMLQKAYRFTRAQADDLKPYIEYGMGPEGALALLKKVQTTINQYAEMTHQVVEAEGKVASIYEKQGMGSFDSAIRREQAYDSLKSSNSKQRDAISHQANLILEQRGI